MTTSGLARRAGLDATTFNRSKRQNAQGQFRWPSTESIAKILAVTGASIESFLLPISQSRIAERQIPCRALEDTASSWLGSTGIPEGPGWEEMPFPDSADHDLYALEIRNDRFAPCYRNGDIIVLSPHAEPRRGDRILLLTTDGQINLLVFVRRTPTALHLRPLASETTLQIPTAEIRLVNRIIWASQ